MMFPCPLCKNPKEVKINQKSRPYLRCDECGVLMFVNRASGISIIQGEKKPVPQAEKERNTLASYFAANE